MKKLACLTILLLLCISCVENKSVKYSLEFHMVNNLGYTIEVFKGDSYYATLFNQEDMILFESYERYDYDDVYMAAFGWPPQDVSVYSQGAYSHELLKTWKFDERDEPGKQLYRLTDSKREVTTEDVDQSFFYQWQAPHLGMLLCQVLFYFHNQPRRHTIGEYQ